MRVPQETKVVSSTTNTKKTFINKHTPVSCGTFFTYLLTKKKQYYIVYTIYKTFLKKQNGNTNPETMKRQQINVNIDTLDYIELKREENLSLTIRQLIKAYLTHKGRTEQKEEETVLKEIHELTKKKEEIIQELMVLNVRLQAIKEETTKKEAEENDQAARMSQAIKNSGVLGDIFD